MHRNGSIVLSLALSLVPTCVAAQNGSPQPIGPDDAVRIALENHPLLRGSAQEVRAAEADRALARSGYLPRLELEEQLARSTNPVFVFASKLGQERFGPSDFEVESLNRPDALTNSATRLMLKQNVWDAGRTRLGRRAASIGIAAAEQSLRRTEEVVRFGALEAFWDLVLADEMLGVVEDAEAVARANLSLASERVDAGLAVPSDRMSAEVRLAETEALRIRSEQGRAVAHAALLRALGLESGGPFVAVPPTGAPGAQDDEVDERIRRALEERRDLQSLDERIRQAQIGVKLARSRRHPEIGAGAQYEWNGDTLLGTDGDNWTVGFGLKLSLFDGGETHARANRARAELARLEARRTEMTQGIRLQVRAAWAERESARRRLEVAAAALESSAEALRIVRERYGEGLAVIVELLGAEAAYTKTRADHVAAESDLWLARARLELASGRPAAPQPSAPPARNDRP